eukprot:TRINITY_DN7557_c0_g1_i1.p1 TRINITY_DN7557_c0_g1~~TRINITY_DN7557_c0_g1_i1.p1  ORF type:complete len:1016 (+),score=162.73 TRINITY_DN7557_c0_g1_i1:88-3135(+)
MSSHGGSQRRRQDPLSRRLCLSSSLLSRRPRLFEPPIRSVPAQSLSPIRAPAKSQWERAEDDRQFRERFVVVDRAESERVPGGSSLLDVFLSNSSGSKRRRKRLPVLIADGCERPVSEWDLSDLKMLNEHSKRTGRREGPKRPCTAGSRRPSEHPQSLDSSTVLSTSLRPPELSVITPDSASAQADQLIDALVEEDMDSSEENGGNLAASPSSTRLACGHTVWVKPSNRSRRAGGNKPQYMQATKSAQRRGQGTSKRSPRAKQDRAQRRRWPAPSLVGEGEMLGGGLYLAIAGSDSADGRSVAYAFAQNTGVQTQPQHGGSRKDRVAVWGFPLGVVNSEPQKAQDLPPISYCRGLCLVRGKLLMLCLEQDDRRPGSLIEYDPIRETKRTVRSHVSLARCGLLCSDGSIVFYSCCKAAPARAGPSLTSPASFRGQRDSHPGWFATAELPAVRPCGGLFTLDTDAFEPTERRMGDSKSEPRLANIRAMAAIKGKLYVAVGEEEAGAGALLEFDRQSRHREVCSSGFGDVSAMCASAKRLYVFINTPASHCGLWELDPSSGSFERRIDVPLLPGQVGPSPKSEPQALATHDGHLYVLHSTPAGGALWDYVVSADRSGARADRLPFSYDEYLLLLQVYERCGADPSRPLSTKSEGGQPAELQQVLAEVHRTMHLTPDPEEMKQMQRERRVKCDLYELLRVLFPGRPIADLRRTRLEHQQEKQRREELKEMQLRAADWRNRYRDRWADEVRAEEEIAEVESLFNYLAGSTCKHVTAAVRAQKSAATLGQCFGVAIGADGAVTEVSEGRPAALGGVQVGWMAVAVNGVAAGTAAELAQLFEQSPDEILCEFRKTQSITRVTADSVFAQLPDRAVLAKSDIHDVLSKASHDGAGRLRLEELALMLDEVWERDSREMVTPDLYYQPPVAPLQRKDDPAARLDALLFPVDLDPETGLSVRPGAMERGAKWRVATPSEPTLVPLPEYVKSCRVCRRLQHQTQAPSSQPTQPAPQAQAQPPRAAPP